MNRRRLVGVLAAATLLVVVAVGLFVAVRVAQPSYTNVGDGVALGPAARHHSAGTDVLVQIASGALSTAAGNATLPAVGENVPRPEEQTLLDMTNADRSQNGLPPLSFDPESLQVARVRAAAQIPDGPLSHYNSLGELAFVGLLGDAGISYVMAGENLARSQSQGPTIVARLNDALMNSPTHRANILEPSFNRLAIGSAIGPDGRLAFAEIFRTTSD